MAFAWFVPTLVAPFGQITNADINQNLLAIQAGFNAQNAQIQKGASHAFATTGSRNVLVDMSNFAGTTTSSVSVTLPPNPVVGDPPVTITILAGATGVGPAAGPPRAISCVPITSDGTKINSQIAGAVGLHPLPFLTNSGDTITLLYVGGSIGWMILDSNISTYVNPPGDITAFYGNGVDYFPNMDMVLDLTNYFGAYAGTGSFTMQVGQSASFTLANLASSLGLQIGSGAQTFNGVAGPYIITTTNVRYKFTCTAANTYIVTF
jgi:hypothetical protein